MIHRFSSRRQRLDHSFLRERLQGAQGYDRIAGFFSSSILEVAGEALESVTGTVRLVCNSGLDPQDVAVAQKAAQAAMRREWCAAEPERLPESARPRFRRLYDFLVSGKLRVKVIPDAHFGLIHGKAGVITLADGRQTAFLGSVNESLTAWRLNYELLWEDDDPDAVAWVQEEFDALWHSPFAVELAEAVVQDIGRLAVRSVIPDLADWRGRPRPGGPGHRVPGLPQGGRALGAPEALRQARLRRPPGPTGRALRPGGPGRAGQDHPARHGRPAHGPGRRSAGPDPRPKAADLAVAGGVAHPAGYAVCGLGRAGLGGRERHRAPEHRARVHPQVPAAGRHRLHRAHRRRLRGSRLAGQRALRVRDPGRGAPRPPPQSAALPLGGGLGWGVRPRRAEQPAALPLGHLPAHQQPAAGHGDPGTDPPHRGMGPAGCPGQGLGCGAWGLRQPVA